MPESRLLLLKVERFLLKSGVLLLESRVGLATTCALLKGSALFSVAFSLSGVRSLEPVREERWWWRPRDSPEVR